MDLLPDAIHPADWRRLTHEEASDDDVFVPFDVSPTPVPFRVRPEFDAPPGYMHPRYTRSYNPSELLPENWLAGYAHEAYAVLGEYLLMNVPPTLDAGLWNRYLDVFGRDERQQAEAWMEDWLLREDRRIERSSRMGEMAKIHALYAVADKLVALNWLISLRGESPQAAAVRQARRGYPSTFYERQGYSQRRHIGGGIYVR